VIKLIEHNTVAGNLRLRLSKKGMSDSYFDPHETNGWRNLDMYDIIYTGDWIKREHKCWTPVNQSWIGRRPGLKKYPMFKRRVDKNGCDAISFIILDNNEILQNGDQYRNHDDSEWHEIHPLHHGLLVSRINRTTTFRRWISSSW